MKCRLQDALKTRCSEKKYLTMYQCMYALPILYTDRHILFQGKHLGMILGRLQYFKTEFTITCSSIFYLTPFNEKCDHVANRFQVQQETITKQSSGSFFYFVRVWSPLFHFDTTIISKRKSLTCKSSNIKHLMTGPEGNKINCH